MIINISDPIPGGCNQEFPIEISSFLRTIYNRNYILVDAAPAQFEDPNCEYSSILIKLRFFMFYLPEQNYDSDVYFEGVKNMMSLNNILRNGRPVSFF